MLCLKVFREDASSPSAERPFQTFVSQNEKYFGPFFKIFFGSLKSVAVFLWFLKVSWDILMKRLLTYSGASS